MESGREHWVILSSCKRHVRKIPTLDTLVSFPLGFTTADIIADEYQQAQLTINQTKVKIPPTRIRVFSKFFYRAVQTYIEEDGSIPNIRQHLAEQNVPILLDEFDITPENFISNLGTVYFVDPTKGPICRLVERWKIMPYPKQRRIMASVANTYKRVKTKLTYLHI